MSESELPLDLEPEKTALFLDCDGTLAPIVAHPDDAAIPVGLLEDLDALARLSGHAVALVSGRSIAQLDAMTAPFAFAASGVHGSERRSSSGRRFSPPIDLDLLSTVSARVADFVVRHPGLVQEPKPASVALHYRMRPDLADEAERLAAAIARDVPGVRLQHGKAVVELRLGSGSKGEAIESFMEEPPFRGRVPVFAGDDVTDEDGFVAVNRLGGIGIKIGSGSTTATRRVADLTQIHDWLGRLRRRWEALAASRSSLSDRNAMKRRA